MSELIKNNKKLIKEWIFEKNKDIDINKITSGSGKKAWWKCHKCGYEWQAEIKQRVRGNNCPACSNKILWEGHNDLATLYPELIEEWDFEKNGDLKPENIIAGSHKKVWWKCKKCNTSYKSMVKTRCNGTGCRNCSYKIVAEKLRKKSIKGNNTLSDKFPKLLPEWDYEKNGDLLPNNIAPYSNKNVWWICSKCGYEWNSPISSRTRGSNCPACANQIVWKGHNDLITIYPELAEEWNYEKNGDLKPEDVSYGSSKIVWWKCEKCGNEWETSVHDRKGTPCPKCNSLVGTSLAEQIVFYYLKKYFKSSINRYRAKWLNPFAEIDIFIPEIKLAIEYDGKQWHNDIQKDIRKNDIIQKNGIEVVRIREYGCPRINNKIKEIYVSSNDEESLTKGIKELIDWINKKYKLNINIVIDIHKDRLKILNDFKKDLGGKSLANSDLSIVDEWNYKKNIGLTPNNFTPFSHKKVWWKCSRCGYEYQAYISVRAQSKKGVCPACSGKVIIKGFNDLLSNRPEIAKEWDYEKNGDLKPDNVAAQSGKKVWWKCPECKREWKASIHDRSIPCNHKSINYKK